MIHLFVNLLETLKNKDNRGLMWNLAMAMRWRCLPHKRAAVYPSGNAAMKSCALASRAAGMISSMVASSLPRRSSTVADGDGEEHGLLAVEGNLVTAAQPTHVERAHISSYQRDLTLLS